MTDFLLEVGQNPQARMIIKKLGLPIPLPEKLRRARGPWEERPFADCDLVCGGSGAAPLLGAAAEALVAAGANPLVLDPKLLDRFKVAGESYGRPARALSAEEVEKVRPDALVFDASAVDEPSQLRSLYDFFHPLVARLKRSGRAVVLARPPETPGYAPARAAAQAALDGFVRSLAKEIGRGGSTAQLVVVEEGAQDRLPALLRFLLSPRSAFLTAQTIRVSARVKASASPLVRPLENKVALVTGAARGIGAATAGLLAQEGAKVVCLDRPEDDGPASRLAREIGGSTLLVDVMAKDAPERIAGELKERFGGVDVVVHNAGVTRDKTLARMSDSAWSSTLDINLVAVINITDALVAGGALRDGGRIVCLASVAGIAGNVGQTNYAASKAGVIGFVRALAPRLAERGIAVNAVAPGLIETRMTQAMPFAIREGGRRLSALGQGGLPEDVGQVITFLSSPGAAGLTGQVVRVCGGALIGA